ncbi:acyltransferase family protein [Pseudarthrobacter sp. ATCC 49987]|uniref:acyltransferase family protein n=1 Tax=Pseudarthrobacter sp. ATCC 49987 TaxID=2698204 RepID=UPI001F4417AB|nr:acyltransferase [Pseudarthrobacter sp. ATCC 49987]
MALSDGRVHLRSLTGFRFYAAMAVVLYHVALYFPGLGHTLDVFGYGFAGVSFFFILSGFVLTWSHGAGDRAGKFYWNRVARVWPLHALTTFLAVLAPPLASTTTIWPALPFVLTLTQSWFPGGGFVTAFNGVSWSLSCEAFFYLLFPLLIKGLRNHRRPELVAGALFTAMVGVGIAVSVSVPGPVAGYLLGWLPLYRLGEFALGICLALLIKNGWRPRFTLGHAVGLTGFLYASLLAASLITSGTPGSAPVTYADLTMMPGFLAMIAAAAASDLKDKASSLSSHTIVRLGQWSFALYLVHELVIRMVRPLVDGSPIGTVFIASALVIAASVLLSGALHELVERPAERWLRAWRTSGRARIGQDQGPALP